MKTIKSKEELFLFGDPRFLSGAPPTHYSGGYESGLAYADSYPDIITSAKLARYSSGASSPRIHEMLSSAGQFIHHGKGHYHAGDHYNIFTRKDDDGPSVGVEIETVTRGCNESELQQELVSNWFHFERDGSLPSNGYECVTDPLGPRYYRNPRLWVGFQNTVNPWLGSWGCSSTGLHVHVGTSRFETCPMESAPGYIRTSKVDRVKLGRRIMACVYYGLASRAFIDSVFMRKPTGYCGECAPESITGVIAAFQSGDETAVSAISHILDGGLLLQPIAQLISRRNVSAMSWSDAYLDWRKNSSDNVPIVDGFNSRMSSHGSELNMDHRQTIEFRRGKGTVNGTTIHKIVEFAAFVEKYTEMILQSPDMVVSSKDFYRRLAEETTSRELADLAEKQL